MWYGGEGLDGKQLRCGPGDKHRCEALRLQKWAVGRCKPGSPRLVLSGQLMGRAWPLWDLFFPLEMIEGRYQGLGL